MGGNQSSQPDPSKAQPPHGTTGQHHMAPSNISKEDQDRIRQQRSDTLRKRMEEQKREELLKNQEVIDFQERPKENENMGNVIHSQIITNPKVTQPAQDPEKVARMIQQQQMLLKSSEDVKMESPAKKLVENPKQEEVKKAAPPKVQITQEQRVHNFISDVFLITNESGPTADKKKTFLYEYCGEGKLFAMDQVDDIFMSRLSKNKDENKFAYLIDTYRRLESHLYVKNKLIDNVEDLKDQIVTYFNTCLQCPETFDLTNNEVQILDNDNASGQDMFAAFMGQGMGAAFQEKLCSNQMFTFTTMQNQLWEAFNGKAIGVHTEFMNKLVDLIKDDDDQCQTMFLTLFNKMHLNLNSIKIDKFREAESQLELLKILFEYKVAQDIFVSSRSFLSENLNGKQIQMETYLGRYLSYSCLSQETKGFKDQYFRGMHKTSQSGIQRMTDTVADQFHNFHKSIQEIIAKLLKNKDAKERVMQWLRVAVGLNQDKSKMFTQIPVCSDGFVLNLIDVMLLFCKPFTSKFIDFHQTFPKVNCFYLMNDKYVINASKVEKLDPDTVAAFQQNASKNHLFTEITLTPHQPSSLDSDSISEWELPHTNFITECFFLSHLLINMITKKLEQLYEQIGKAINEAAAKKDLASYDEYYGMKMCIDAHVMGKNTMAGFRSLFTFTGALFICLNNYEYYIPHQEIFENIDTFQQRTLKLPIAPVNNMPIDIAVLPTCILTNLSTLPKLFRQYYPEVYLGKELDLHIQLATNIAVILNKRLKNPHLRADMITLFAMLVPQSFVNRNKHEKQQREDNIYKDIFFQNYAMKEYLIESIVNVYVDAERTGYYEKATFRYYASLVMEYIWSDSNYRDKFVQLGQEKPGLFIEFCNFLINDVNNLLFDGLLELGEIKDYEELASSPDWTQLDQEMQQQMTAKFEENKKKAKSHFQLSNMVVQLLAKVTTSIQAPFTSEELGEMFANALNFCVDSLVSQKGLKLRVQNPERYNFEPHTLLINILTMYANMSGEEKFLHHVVNDARSYKTETFEKAARILQNPKKGVQLDQELQARFENMVYRLKNMRNEIDLEEGLYDDAPDEFLDPLMNTLMKEPVELPSSKTVIDYITIKKHLMNDPRDPINRSPLTLEQLIPRTDIKEKIEAYKDQKRQQRQQQNQ